MAAHRAGGKEFQLGLVVFNQVDSGVRVWIDRMSGMHPILEAAEYIYGITMEEPGVSNVVSMHLTET